MTIGTFLKERRLVAGKKQMDVVMQTRIPQNQISDYEHDRAVPSAVRFIKIMRALEVNTLDLTQFEEEMEDTDPTKGLYSRLERIAA